MPDEPPWPQENRDLLYGNWETYGIETKTEKHPVTKSETTVLGFPLARLVVLISCATGGSLGCYLGTISREEDWPTRLASSDHESFIW